MYSELVKKKKFNSFKTKCMTETVNINCTCLILSVLFTDKIIFMYRVVLITLTSKNL